MKWIASLLLALVTLELAWSITWILWRFELVLGLAVIYRILIWLFRR